MAKIQINQSVAILVDGNNIERSIHEDAGNTQTMINFDSVVPRLLNGRGLKRLIYFKEGKNISSKLAERLHTQFYGSVIPCHKTADIPLTIKAMQLASKVDTIIIMSGDSDFIDLVRHLKFEGVRVEIAAVEKTTSRFLIPEVDYFHRITRNDWFKFSSPSRPFRKKPSKPAAGLSKKMVPVKTSVGPVSAKPALPLSPKKALPTPVKNFVSKLTAPLKKKVAPAVKKPVLKKPAVKKVTKPGVKKNPANKASNSKKRKPTKKA